MPRFLLEHMDGCTPFVPCASCKGLAMLRKKFKEYEMRQFLDLMREAAPEIKVVQPESTRLLNKLVNLDQSWDDVLKGLPNRIRYCLHNKGLVSLRDVVAMPTNEARAIPNFGKTSLAILQEELASHGLYLGMDVPKQKVDDVEAETSSDPS